MRRRAPAVAASVALACGSAAADQPLWEAGAGVGGLQLPHYRGSDRHDSWLLPVPYFVYHGTILRADRHGTRAMLLRDQRYDVDLSVSASAPTQSRDDPARAGMADLAPTVEFGPKLNLHLWSEPGWKVDLRVPLRAVVTVESRPHAIGWNVAPVLNLDTEAAGIDIGLQAGPLWGSRKLHSYYYDVAPSEATSTRPAYTAPGGFAGWQATAALSRRSGRLWAGAYVRADSVAGAAFEPSPLVRSRHQVSLGFALAWVFAASSERVPDDDD